MDNGGDPYLETEPCCNDRYFLWLCSDLSLHDTQDHWNLLYQLYCKEYYYIHPGDAKLVDDTLELRAMFQSAWRSTISDETPVNVLEVIRYLSIRLSCMIADLSDREWFWILMKNLKLDKFSDLNFTKYGGSQTVNYRIAMWLTRRYNITGHGGLFPLSAIRFFLEDRLFKNGDDQTKLSTYEQMIAYVRTEYCLSRIDCANYVYDYEEDF